MYRMPTSQCILFEYIVLNGSVTRHPYNGAVQAVLQQLGTSINNIVATLQNAPANLQQSFAAELAELQQTQR